MSVVWRIAARMTRFMTLGQEEIFAHLQNIRIAFNLDEELTLFAYSLIHRYIRAVGNNLVFHSDAEFMYVFLVCITLA
jgi:hypothetical protein